MSGGKGGSQTTQVEIPQWLSNAAQANLMQGRDVSRIGYTPYYGPEVAALTPTQQAARSNIGQFAQAFGMQGVQDMALGAPTTYQGGIQGYSSGSLYDQAVQELAARRPGQYAAIQRQFIDPLAGLNQTTAGGSSTSYKPYMDPYASYFQTPSYDTSGMPSVQNATEAEIYANAAAGNAQTLQPANIEFNGQVYNLNDPAQAEAYRIAYLQSAAPSGPVVANQPSAADAIAGLKGAADWKTISKQEKINRAVNLARTQGLTAQDLAPVLNLPAATIQGYL